MKQKLFSLVAGLGVILASVINPMENPVRAQGNEVIVEGNITQNTTWTPDKEYVLNGAVFVKELATLTILPGTTIKGLDRSLLVIDRGAKIMAEGTPTAPIVFTSAQEPGSRTPRDWGGVWINGRDPYAIC
ncbi:MAG: hypothetical protein HY314_09890 [Acidobacteria bacterium]|nr:hypothetical protein [Acidobacteriota bacterium]